MKKITILRGLTVLAVAGVFALTSCDKQTIAPENNDTADSQAILVTQASISSDDVFVVNAVPAGSSKDSITAAELPTAIGTYLAANYSGYTYFKTFKLTTNGTTAGYVVVINFNGKPVGLKFDAGGTFIKVCEQRERGQLNGKGWKRGGRFDGRDGQHRDTIALSALATTIKAYMLVTYPQDTLLAAHVGRGGDIIVISTNSNLYATAFNSSGVFLKRAEIVLNKGKKTAITQAQLSATIASYLTATYPGYVFHRAYEVKINSVTQAYVVIIDSNDTKYALHFNASGTLVKAIAIR